MIVAALTFTPCFFLGGGGGGSTLSDPQASTLLQDLLETKISTAVKYLSLLYVLAQLSCLSTPPGACVLSTPCRSVKCCVETKTKESVHRKSRCIIYPGPGQRRWKQSVFKILGECCWGLELGGGHIISSISLRSVV